jgi:hypothetical protein
MLACRHPSAYPSGRRVEPLLPLRTFQELGDTGTVFSVSMSDYASTFSPRSGPAPEERWTRYPQRGKVRFP